MECNAGQAPEAHVFVSTRRWQAGLDWIGLDATGRAQGTLHKGSSDGKAPDRPQQREWHVLGSNGSVSLFREGMSRYPTTTRIQCRPVALRP